MSSIGLPTLEISFQKAAEAVSTRVKNGICAVIVRDASVTVLTTLAMKKATEIPTTLGKNNVSYISLAFTGTDLGTPSKVILAILPAAGLIADALTALEHYSIDYLCGPEDATADDITAIKTWVIAQRGKYRTVKGVLPATVADDKGIINFATASIITAAGTFTAAQYSSRIAGILAGTPISASSTFAGLSEVTSVSAVADADAEIKAGKLILIHDGTKAKIARGVNSLTTVPATGNEDWKKIKIVEAMDLMTYYARTTIEDEYIGKCANTYDNKCLLVTALQTFLTALEGEGVLLAGSSSVSIDVTAQEAWLKENGTDVTSMTDDQIKKADTGSWVFIAITATILDAMEDFVLNFTV